MVWFGLVWFLILLFVWNAKTKIRRWGYQEDSPQLHTQFLAQTPKGETRI